MSQQNNILKFPEPTNRLPYVDVSFFDCAMQGVADQMQYISREQLGDALQNFRNGMAMAYYLLNGDFPDARRFANEKTQELLNILSTDYAHWPFGSSDVSFMRELCQSSFMHTKE